MAEARATMSKLDQTISDIEVSKAKAKEAELGLEQTLGRIDKMDQEY